VGYDALVEELKDISLLLLASRYGCPDTLAPLHCRLVAGALCHTTVDDRVTNLSLGAVVGGFDARMSESPV
jgi:hypothetical protein